MREQNKKFFRRFSILGLLGLLLLLLLLIISFKPWFPRFANKSKEIEILLDKAEVKEAELRNKGKGIQREENLPYIKSDKKAFTKKVDPSDYQIRDKKIFELIK